MIVCHTNAPVDLKARAHQAMLDEGFHPDFSAEVLREIQSLPQNPPNTNLPGIRDLRDLLWSSIDNDTSRDLDQIEYAEKLPDGTTKVLVGVADVDAFVSKGSPIDAHAAKETCTIYAGVRNFPMIP